MFSLAKLIQRCIALWAAHAFQVWPSAQNPRYLVHSKEGLETRVLAWQYLKWNRPWKTIHISLRRKTSVSREHKRRSICNFSLTDYYFFVKMDKIRKGSDLRKEKWGSPSIQENKIAANLHCHAIAWTFSEKTWVHSYPMMPHAFTFHSCGKCFLL